MKERKNIIKLLIYYISFIFFSISSIVGQEIYGSLKEDN